MVEASAAGIGVEMLADVNVLVSAVVMTVLESATPTPKERFSC